MLTKTVKAMVEIFYLKLHPEDEFYSDRDQIEGKPMVRLDEFTFKFLNQEDDYVSGGSIIIYCKTNVIPQSEYLKPMNTSANLNEFSKDQLQWMLNKATDDIVAIGNWKEMVESYGLENTLTELWKQKKKQLKFLEEITCQVLNAMNDQAERERVMNN